MTVSEVKIEIYNTKKILNFRQNKLKQNFLYLIDPRKINSSIMSEMLWFWYWNIHMDVYNLYYFVSSAFFLLISTTFTIISVK